MGKVFKVLLETLGDKSDPNSVRRWSAVTGGEYRIEYLLGKRIFPTVEGSYLYAFKSLDDALAYINPGKRYDDTILSMDCVLRVYACEAEIVNVPAYCTAQDENIEKFWQERWFDFVDRCPHVCQTPPGTVLCGWLWLKEMVATDGRVLKTKANARKSQKTFAW